MVKQPFHAETVPAEAPLPSRLWRAWDQFWFTPADPTLLGIMRILCGLVVLYVHFAYTFDLQALIGEHAWYDLQAANEFRKETPWGKLPTGWGDPEIDAPKLAPDKETLAANRAFYEKWGMSPYAAENQGYIFWSIWFHVSDPTAVAIVHGCILGIIFLFTIGFCTRITGVLTWLAVLSYIQRAPTTLFGMDTIMNVVLLYLVIAPSGAALSVDRLIARFWAVWRALRDHKPAPLVLAPRPRVSANVAYRLLQIHFCLIYLASGTSKLLGAAWWNGTALWGTLANYEFCPMQYRLYQESLVFLSQHRLLWELFMGGGVVFTLLLELGFPFLIWIRPLRWVMMAGSLLLHTGIAFFMGLTTFSAMMIIMLLCFTPQEAIARWQLLLGRNLPRFRLWFQARERRQVRAASVIRAFDAWDQVELQEQGSRLASGAGLTTAEDKRLHLVTPSGETLSGYDLFAYLLRTLCLLRPLQLVLWLPGVAALGKAWYPEAESAMPSLKAVEGRKEPVTSGVGAHGKR